MPIDPIVLIAFLPASLALNLTPGADMMFCLGIGLRSGARPALAASAGISVGAFVHVILAALGLSALLAAHPAAFEVIRWGGVAYLLYLAWRALRTGPAAARGIGAGAAKAFRDGLLVNLSNPKVILFVLAFLPQFTDPARPLLPQFLMLGAFLSLGGFIINGAVGAFAGRAAGALAGAPHLGRWLGRLSAAVFAGLALRLALSSTR